MSNISTESLCFTVTQADSRRHKPGALRNVGHDEDGLDVRLNGRVHGHVRLDLFAAVDHFLEYCGRIRHIRA